MDRYKFRGKRLNNGEWVYGCLIKGWMFDENRIAQHTAYIQKDIHDRYPIQVEPSTVGQYTGETDIEGTELYEQDKVQHVDAKWIGTIYFKDGAYRIRNEAGSWELLSYRAKKVKRVKGE